MIRAVSEQPRQIYTSMQDRARRPDPSFIRTVVVALLAALVIAVILVAIVSLV